MTVTVRPATPDDSRRLFDWRNDPVTRAMSLTTDPVPWEVHTLWFATVMNSRNRPIFIGERDGVAIGMVRFDISGDLAEISVALAPEARGQRLATPLLRAAIAALHAQRPVAILAEVRPENTASRRAFLAAGFREEQPVDGILRFRLSAPEEPGLT